MRDARAVMHAGIANWRWQRKRSLHSSRIPGTCYDKKWGRLTCWSPTTSVTSQKRCPVHRSCIRLTKWDELVESSWKWKLPSADSRSGGHDGGEVSRDAMAEPETERQYETVLLYNDVSEWLGEYLKSALQRMIRLSLVITRSIFSHLLTQNTPYIALQGKV